MTHAAARPDLRPDLRPDADAGAAAGPARRRAGRACAGVRAALLGATAALALGGAVGLVPAPGLAPTAAMAGPKGGTVTRGAARIATRDGVTTIRQGSRKVVIDWRSFDIAEDEAVRFLQPDGKAIALNRVLDDLPTHIRGKLSANGQVWLVNPSGIYFHAGSVIDVGGLVASSADIGDDAFMRGDHRFDRPGDPDAKIVNDGRITFGEAGLVGIVAPHAENRGEISGKLGRIVIAGQKGFSVDVSGDGLFEIDLADAPAGGGAVARAINSGLLSAPGGMVVISAAAVRDAVEAAVQVGGVVSARSARRRGGTIVLSGGAGRVEVTGTLDARGATGGAIEIGGGAAHLTGSARLDVSGRRGGGSATIGALDMRAPIPRARPTAGGMDPATLRGAPARVVTDPGATILADATVRGDGGRAALLASDAQGFYGAASARGGPRGGAGGFVEISAPRLDFDGAADLGAPAGAPGRILFDPLDLVVGAAGPDDFRLAGGIAHDEDPAATYAVSAGALSAIDGATTLQAVRDIRIEAAIDNPRPTASLTLEAGRHIRVAADVIFAGALRFEAGAAFPSFPGDGGGSIVFDAPARIAAEGGLTLLTGVSGALDGRSLAGGEISLRSGAGLALPRLAVLGDVTVEAAGAITQTAAGLVSGTLSAATEGGAITLDEAANRIDRFAADTNLLDLPGVAADVALRGDADVDVLFVEARNLDLRASGALTATGPVIARGDATLTAGGAIHAADPGNVFGGAVTALTAGGGAGPRDVTLAASGDLALGRIEADALDLAAGGDITDTDGLAIEAAGAARLASADGDIILDAPDLHDFAGQTRIEGGAATVSDRNALAIAGAATDEVTLRAADIDLFDALSVGAAADGALTIVATGDASLGAGGGLLLDAAEIARVAAGSTRLEAAGDIAASGPLDLAPLGDVTLAGGAATLDGTIVAGGALTVLAAGELSAGAAALTVPGALRIEAGGDADLSNAANLLSGAVSADVAGDLTLAAADALTLGPVSAAAADISAAGAISGDGPVATTGGARILAYASGGDDDPATSRWFDIDLTGPGNAFGGAVSFVGDAVSLSADGALSVADSHALSAASLTAGGALDAARLSVGAGAAAGPTLTLADGGALTIVAGGDATLTDVFAGALRIGGPGTAAGPAAALDGAVELRRAALGSLTIGAAAGALTLSEMVLTGGGSADGAASLDLRRIEAGGALSFAADGAARIEGLRAPELSVTAGQAELGFVEAGTLRVAAAAGGVAQIADADLADLTGGASFALAAPGAPRQDAADAPVIADQARAIGGFARMIAVADRAELTASGDVSLTGARLGGADLANDFNVVSLEAGGDAALADATGLALDGARAASLDLASGGGVTQTARVAVAGLTTIEAAGAVTLDRADNDFATATVTAAEAALADADGFALRGSTLGGDLTLGGAAQAGGLTVADVSAGGATQARALGAIDVSDLDAGGDAGLTAGGALTLRRVAVAGGLEASGAGIDARDLSVGAAATLTSGADATLTRALVGAGLSVSAGGDAALEAVAATGAAEADAGGRLDAAGLRAATLSAEAGAGIDLDATLIAGAASLRAGGGDIVLRAVSAGGALRAVADRGAIRTGQGDFVLDAVAVAAPGGGAGGAAPRVRLDRLLRVGGNAWFDAAGDVRLVHDRSGAARGQNDFLGAVTVSRAANVVIEDANDLRIGAPATVLPGVGAIPGAGIGDRIAGAVTGAVRLIAGGDLTESGAAVIRAAGDARYEAGGDVILDNGRHRIGGAVSAEGGAVTLTGRNGLRLGPIEARGALVVTAGARGATGAAAIVQTSRVEAPATGMTGGVAGDAMEVFAGAVTVRGDAEFATGLDAGAALDDPALASARGLALTDPANVFEGTLALRRISGSATVVEEATKATMATDGRDGGALRLRQIEVGGDLSLTTSDDVVLLGRMTALPDAAEPEERPSIPGAPTARDLRAQGRAGLAEDRYRLFLADGATLRIDATAGGLDPRGGAIRFDRAIDARGGPAPERSAQSVLGRGRAPAVVLDAGDGGDIRLRDYAGAGAALGDVTVRNARNVTLGVTYAAREPDERTGDGRFLLGRKPEDHDILFAHDIEVDAHGEVVIVAPPGLKGAYEENDDYFGVNALSFTYGLKTEPALVDVFGFIGETGRKAAGLFPVGPRGPNFNFNGCVIGDIQDCTSISAPSVLDVVRVERATIINVREEDLLELFVSFGNEELWGVPPSYFLDVYDPGDATDRLQTVAEGEGG